MKQKMIASARMTYGTRRLSAGDTFDASRRDARLLAVIGKAREAREPGALPPPPAELKRKAARGSSKKPAGADLAELRAEYQHKVGKRPFPGWDADELRRRMEAADAS